MDTGKRVLAKSVTWQLMGLVSMTFVGAAVTGSVSAGGGIALIGAGVGFVCYVVHEALWSHVSWGQRKDQGNQQAAVRQSTRLQVQSDA